MYEPTMFDPNIEKNNMQALMDRQRSEIERLTPYVEAFLREETRADNAERRIDDLNAKIDKGAPELQSLRDENARLRAALKECAADWSSSPGTVLSCQAEINNEFQRRMEIAAMALNHEQKAPQKQEE